MNRTQAIESAANLRNKTSVYTLTAERTPFIPAVKAVAEVLNEDNTVKTAAVEAADAIPAQPRKYDRKEYKTINKAKHAMRNIGRGVALLPGETLPK